MEFEIKDGLILNVAITGGCDGNSKGIAKLLEGMEAKEAIARMKGILCGRKPTSCPDRLACAMENYVNSAGSESEDQLT